MREAPSPAGASRLAAIRRQAHREVPEQPPPAPATRLSAGRADVDAVLHEQSAALSALRASSSAEDAASSAKAAAAVPAKAAAVPAKAAAVPAKALAGAVLPARAAATTPSPAGAAASAQRSVDVLLSTHASSISLLRARVATEYGFVPGEHDEIFVLRFLLSHGSVEAAETPLKRTIAWRRARAAELARARAEQPTPRHAAMAELLLIELLEPRTARDEPILLVRVGRSDVRTLMDRWSEDEVADYLTYFKEAAFAACDRATRATRRLVKLVTVIDMEHALLSTHDPRFLAALHKSSRDGTAHYPQLLELTMPIHTPPFVDLLWYLGKNFVPERTLAKIHFCADFPADCPLGRHHFSPEVLSIILKGRQQDLAV